VADPDAPTNGGTHRPVHLTAPPGSLVAALPPVAVAAGNVETAQRIADVLLGAIAGAAPHAVGAASQGTMNNVLIGGEGAAGPFVYYETIGGGQGGRPGKAGASAVHTGMTNTQNTPVEALEAHFPIRVRRYAVRRGSGGAGRYAGGDGIVRELELLVPVTVSLLTDRRSSRPFGLDGGEPGLPGENVLRRDGRELPLAAKVTFEARAGDVLVVRTPGGGGLGHP